MGYWMRKLEVKEQEKESEPVFAKLPTEQEIVANTLTKIGDNPNINLKDAMEFAGHKDVKTFITHYCFSRYTDEKKRMELEKTLNS